MGTKYIRQGECKECGRLTHDFCDSCGIFLCEDHRFEKKLANSMKNNVFCKKCLYEHKKPLDPERKVI